MIKMLLANDLIFEAILNRNNFFPDAQNFFEILQSQQVQGHISSICLEKVCSIARASVINSENFKQSEEEVSKQLISLIKNMRISICKVDSFVIQESRLLDVSVAESAVEVACAVANNLEGIITLHPNNFTGCTLLPIFSEKQFRYEVLYRQQKPINLNQWLQGDYDSSQGNWQPVENILEKRVVFNFRSSHSHKLEVNRAKKIFLSNGCLMGLVGRIFFDINDELNIFFQLHPIDTPYILKNTRLFLLDELGHIFMEVQSRITDNWIQIHFVADAGDKFSIKVEQGDSYYLEYFVID